jgi:ribosomal protein S12 methylthiotransferase
MTQLVGALSELAAQYGAWVRLHYVYPYPHVDDVIPLMNGGHVLPYLDVPLQHAHPDVLKRMKRPANGEKNIERIQAWRKMCPDITIRSTFIAGFPGETDAEFDYLLDFLKEAEIDRLGCFSYSPVEGATANDLPNPVPEELREERRGRVMELQEAISKKRLQAKVGKTIRVLIDEVERNGSGIGRSAADAPEIDGVVYVKPPYEPHRKLKVGEFVEAEVNAADAHDLWANAV